MNDFYKVLGVEKSATHEEIRRRYLFLVKAYHPDRYVDPHDKSTAEEEIKRINEAYDVIGDEIKRNKYDSEYINIENERTKNNSSSQQSTTEEDKEIKETINYFEYLVEKWKYCTSNIKLTEIKVDSFERLIDVISFLLKNAKSISDAKRENISRDIYTWIEFTAKLQISLGLEFESNGKNLRFPKEYLLQSSTYLLIIATQELIDEFTPNEKEQNQIIEAIQILPIALITSARKLFEYGQNAFKTVVINSKEKNSSFTKTPFDFQQNENNCEGCGRFSVIQKAIYRKNIGMVFFRKYSKAEGKYCPSCQEKLFWNALLTNLFLGWWGVISFVINPFLILMNICNYIKSWRIRRYDPNIKRSLVDWKLLIPFFIVLFLFFIIVDRSIGSQNNLINQTNSTNSIQNKSSLDRQETVNQNILLFDDFSDQNSGLPEKNNSDVISGYKDGIYSIELLNNDYSYYIATSKTFTDGIVKIDLLNSYTKKPDITDQFILWRANGDSFYSVDVYSNNSISVIKNKNGEIIELYQSTQPILCSSLSKCQILISFIGDESKIYINNSFLTTIHDNSYSSGSVGFGLQTTANSTASAFFDNFYVYSSAEIKNLPTPISPTIAPINKTKDPVNKIIVTVINNSSYPQEVYCEGIYIFTLQPLEKNIFRFQRGKWRIDTCYPGTYPCNNRNYVDMNYGELNYTIQ